MLPHPLTTNSETNGDKRMLFGAEKTGQDSPGNGYGIWDVELELDLGLGLGLVLEVDTDRVPTLSLSFL